MAKKQNAETPEQKKYRETVEQIAGNISALAKAVTAMLNGPLNRKAIVRLLAASSMIPMNQVEQVLKALEDLEKDWLNK